MPDDLPIRILVLAGPTAPGAEALLGRAEAARGAGRRLRILLSGGGLAWMRSARLARLAGADGVDVGLCSRSARAEGVEPEGIPRFVRWTSLVAFFTDLEADAPLWGLLP